MYIRIAMIRTQIYLPKSQVAQLKTVARKKRTTVSSVVQLCVEKYIAPDRGDQQKKKDTKGVMSGLFEALEEIKKRGEKGPRDLAQNMDKYYYGSI